MTKQDFEIVSQELLKMRIVPYVCFDNSIIMPNFLRFSHIYLYHLYSRFSESTRRDLLCTRTLHIEFSVLAVYHDLIHKIIKPR